MRGPVECPALKDVETQSNITKMSNLELFGVFRGSIPPNKLFIAIDHFGSGKAHVSEKSLATWQHGNMATIYFIR